MDDTWTKIVRLALGLHLSREPRSIAPTDRLTEDLGLDALDLVLVVLRLENYEHAEFPVADLETVRTVEELAELVGGWSRAAHGDERPTYPELEPRPARTSSGTRRAATMLPASRRAAAGE